jgi:hypothetical protein
MYEILTRLLEVECNPPYHPINTIWEQPVHKAVHPKALIDPFKKHRTRQIFNAQYICLIDTENHSISPHNNYNNPLLLI